MFEQKFLGPARLHPSIRLGQAVAETQEDWEAWHNRALSAVAQALALSDRVIKLKGAGERSKIIEWFGSTETPGSPASKIAAVKYIIADIANYDPPAYLFWQKPRNQSRLVDLESINQKYQLMVAEAETAEASFNLCGPDVCPPPPTAKDTQLLQSFTQEVQSLKDGSPSTGSEFPVIPVVLGVGALVAIGLTIAWLRH